MPDKRPISNLDNNAHSSSTCFQLAIWLLKKVAIPFDDATEYSKGLISLGFNSPHALIHEAMAEDLQKAGVKMDDQRRLLKAIGREMCDVEPESLTSNFSISDSNVSFNQPGDSKMSDASSIPVLRCKRCTVICEDDKGPTTTCIVEPGQAGFMICTTSSPPLPLERMDSEGNGIFIWSPPAAYNLSIDPIQWSVGEVAAWVENVLVVEDAMLYSALFRNASVSEEDFKAIGILENSHRKFLLKNLYKLRQMRRTQNSKCFNSKKGSLWNIATPFCERNKQHLKQPMDMGNNKDLNGSDLSNSSNENNMGNIKELYNSPRSPIIAGQPVRTAGGDVEGWLSPSTSSHISATGGGNGNATKSPSMDTGSNGKSLFIYTDSAPSTPVQNRVTKNNTFKEEKISKSRPTVPYVLERKNFDYAKSPHSSASTPCNHNVNRCSGFNNCSRRHSIMQRDINGLNKRQGSGSRALQPQQLLRPMTTAGGGVSEGSAHPRNTEASITVTPPHLELPRMPSEACVQPNGVSNEGVSSLCFRDLLRTNGISVAPFSHSTNFEDTGRGNLAVGAPDKSFQTTAPLHSVSCESSELVANARTNYQNDHHHHVSQTSILSMDGTSICSSKMSTPRQLCNSTLLLDELGRGAGGIVYRALHFPSLRIVAVKSIPLSEDQNRNQAVREMCAMHDINKVQLESVMASLSNQRSSEMVNSSSSHSLETRQRSRDGFDGIELCEIRSDCSLEESPGAFSVPQTHPHIVAFYDAYIDPEKECMCILLEQMEAGTLQCAVKAGRALSEDELVVVSRSVLQGLSRMHAQKKIHRDIKPSNILLDRYGKVKISDFGVVRDLTSSSSIAKTFTGTLCYMSPERITGDDHSYSSDIWSLGLVLVTLARGAFPFARAGYWDILLAVQESPPPQLPEGNYSPEAFDFVACMLQQDPAKRHTADQLLTHPFITNHKGKNRVAGLVRELRALADAQQNSVNSLNIENILSRLVEYEAEVAIYELSCHEREIMMQAPDHHTEDQEPLKLVLHRFHRSAFRTLARQLETPSKELADTYSHLVTQMEFHCNSNLDEILTDYRHASTPSKIHFLETSG